MSIAPTKVCTLNYLSAQTFERLVRVAWSPVKEVKITHVEDNLFSVQLFFLGDWLKVEHGGPRLFRQHVVSVDT
jgi:hypothetical protein